MPKINRITAKKTFGQILKQKKLDKIKAEQARIQADIAKQEAQFDAYVKQTASEMLKSFPNPRIDLNVANHSESFNTIYSQTLIDSVWAPWSKMANKRTK